VLLHSRCKAQAAMLQTLGLSVASDSGPWDAVDMAEA
jgi:hypothetical protein